MPAVTPSDGPVAVTGASGYIGSQIVVALVKHGFTVHACVTDLNNPDKTNHLLALNKADYSGNLELFSANLLEAGSYDAPFKGCSAVLHAATPMGYGGKDSPREVYDGAIIGTKSVLKSAKNVGTVKRFIYTSSFSAIHHPMKSGYVFSEKDWASDNRENDPDWSVDRIDQDRNTAYAMAKVECEHIAYDFAEKSGQFDAISALPLMGLGPLLSRVHELPGSWQWWIGRMLEGKICEGQWFALWNIVDVRDVGEAQALMIESNVCKNGWRYLLSATDESGEIDVLQLQAHLQTLFPEIDVGGPPEEIHKIIEKYGAVYQAPLGRIDRARKELGLKTHKIENTLYETGRTLIDLGIVEPALK